MLPLLLSAFITIHASSQCVRPRIQSIESLRSQTIDFAEVQSQVRQPIDVFAVRVLLYDPSGFFDSQVPWQSVTMGERRRQVLKEVLEDLWWTLPQLRRLENRSQRLLIDFNALPGADQTTAAWAEPLFLVNNRLKASVVDPAAHQLITSGIDPLQELASSRGHHGGITLNTNVAFDLNADRCDPDKISLYGVILHEVLHLLGVSSIVSQNCYESGGTYHTKVISRWDALLKGSNLQHLISYNCDDIAVNLSSDLFGSCSVILDDTILATGLKLLSSDGESGCLRDGSHLNNEASLTNVMSPSLSRGQFVNILSPRDGTLLSLLGYEVSDYYGTPGSIRYRAFLHYNVSPIPISIRDTLKVSYGVTTKVPVSDLSKNDNNCNTLLCLVSERSDLGLVINSTRDSFELLPLGDSRQGGWLDQTWANQDYIGSTQRAFVEYVDSSAVQEKPCPPNTICNGDFENVARLGPADTKPHACGNPTTFAYWKMDYGSVDAFLAAPITLERFDQDSDSFQQWYTAPGGRAGMAPQPRGTEDGERNLAYVGMIAYRELGKEIEEGISQSITVNHPNGQELYIFQFSGYAPSPNEYTKNAAFRLIVTDTSECGWTSCEPSPRSILDTVLICDDANVWLHLRTRPTLLINGKFKVRITSTRCFRPSPYYGQGINPYIFVDDLTMIPMSGRWKSYCDPEIACAGLDIRIVSKYTLGIQIPSSITSRVLTLSSSAITSSKETSSIIHDPESQNNILINLLTLPVSTPIDRDVSALVERVVVFNNYTLVDTVSVPIGIDRAVVNVGNFRVNRWLGTINGSCTVTNSGYTPVTATGSLSWRIGTSSPGRLTIHDKSSDAIVSGDAQAYDRTTTVPFTVHIPGMDSILLAVRGDQDVSDSLLDQQQLRIALRSISTSCASVALATFNDEDLSESDLIRIIVFPQPAQDFVKVRIRASEPSITSLNVFDILGRRIENIETPSDLRLGKQFIDLQFDSRSLSTGAFYLVVEGALGVYRSPFFIAR